MEDNNISEVLDKLQKDMLVPDLIKDNKAYFAFETEDISHRVIMPTQKELAEATRLRNSTRIKLLQKGPKEGYLIKDELIKVLKANGVDILQMQSEIDSLVKESIQIHLTAAKRKDSEEKAINKLEEKQLIIEGKMKQLSNKKAEHLSPAIEYQAEDVWYKYLTSCCTEKIIKEKDKEDKWEKVWTDFKKFGEDNSLLPYLAEGKLSALIMNV